MSLLAAVGRCAVPGPGPWRWLGGGGQWRALLLVGKCSAAWEPAVASRRGPEPRIAWRGPAGAASCMARRKQVLLPRVESLRCFSTSPLPDNPEYGRLVYCGNLAKAVLGVKFFSYSTSMLSLCMMPVIIFKTGVGVDSLPLQIAFFSVVGFFTFVTPVTLHLITKGYVIRLYHKAETDTYTAITYNAILAEKKTVFHQKDVKVPDISKMFTTFYARTKSMLVNPELFRHPQDYSHLMGYDKPFTFDLEDSKESAESK
ncbi:transmembrane protein 70, mitochondrial [Eublepharis macularius]|uniref:Transmembrane protein 70, mitochondrial n=1 Tax=Eublepharis macularius TaxID=481883 RepID=A0AA97L682_EUBMA|nr:transmembrane protein 70, mitochondrial [Eublepharis macularius]